MSHKKCADCFYYDVCGEDEACEFFDPITENAKDLQLENRLWRERKKFYSDWTEYIDYDRD